MGLLSNFVIGLAFVLMAAATTSPFLGALVIIPILILLFIIALAMAVDSEEYP